jgi:helicase
MSPDFADVNISRGVRRAQEELVESYTASGLLPDSELECMFKDPKVDWIRGAIIGMILRDWVEEVPEREILENYGIEAGDLRVIRESGEWLAYAAAVIAQTLSAQDRAADLFKLVERIKHGVKEDALELVRIKYVGRVRARTMISYGIKTVGDVLAREDLVRRLFGNGWGERIIEEAKKLIK